MKQFLILLAFVCANTITKAQQIRFKNANLNNPDTALMYMGVPNQISIEGLKWGKDIILTSSIEGATFDDNHLITFTPKMVRRDSLVVYKKSKELAKYIWESIAIPDPKLLFGKIALQEKDGKLQADCTVNDIIISPIFRLDVSNCFYKMNTSVNTYQISVYDHQEKLLFNETIAGWMLTFNHLTQIKGLKKGSKIVLDNIKIFTPDQSTARTLQSIQLNIL